MRHTFPREFYIPKGATEVADKQSDAVAYLSETKGGYGVEIIKRPLAVVFFGKQAKPVINGWYRTEERRAAAVEQAFANRRAWLERKAQARKERVAYVPDYKIGDILHTSWGYDQTNVEFFEVVEARGKYVWLRELQQERTETGWCQGTCKPIPGKFAEPRYDGDDRGVVIRRLAQKGGVKIDDVRSAWRGAGEHRWSSYA